jgi:hypothetical protein
LANFSDAIDPQQNVGDANSFMVRAQIEEAGQTFVYGTPVMVKAADGGLQAWDGTTVAFGIAGIMAEIIANNLGSTGSGAPVGFSPVLGIGSVVGNYTANSNQPSAVITPPMVPMSDGRLRFFVASQTTVFRAKIGTSVSVTPIATAQTQVGAAFGLTKDSGNNFWYVDTNKTGANAVLQIVGIDPREPIGTVGGHVLFVFLNSAIQIIA